MVIKRSDSLVVNRLMQANQPRNNTPDLTGTFQKDVGPTTISLSTLSLPLWYISPTSSISLPMISLAQTTEGTHGGAGTGEQEAEPEMATLRPSAAEKARARKNLGLGRAGQQGRNSSCGSQMRR
jgi:hypothetical protein